MHIKIHMLKEQCHSLTPLGREVRLNRIDELAIYILKNAEKKCRKFRTDELVYSPEKAKAGKTWYF